MKITITYKFYNKIVRNRIIHCTVKIKQLKSTHPATIIFDRRMTP